MIALIRIYNPISRVSDTNRPPLALACLQGYLKQNSINVSIKDISIPKMVYDNYVMEDFGRTTATDKFSLFESPNLGIILSVVELLSKEKNLNHLYAKYEKNIIDYCIHYNIGFNEFKQIILDIDNDCQKLAFDLKDIPVVGFQTMYYNMLQIVITSIYLKQYNANVRILYGGAHSTLTPNLSKLLLKVQVVDGIAIGEGEITLLEAIRNLNELEKIKGLMTYNQKNEKFVFSHRPPLDINNLPTPDYSGIDISKYDSLHTYTSRGCIAKCHFCCEWDLHGCGYRKRSHTKVIDDMEKLQDEYTAYKFVFSESMINGSEEWLKLFANDVIKRKINFEWEGFMRSSITPELANLLKASGLVRVRLGVESLNDYTLNDMNKGRNSAKAIESIKHFLSAGVRVHLNLIGNFPSDKPLESMLENIKGINNFKNNSFIREHKDLITMEGQPFLIRPGSSVYKKPEKFGFIIENWDANTLNLKKFQDLSSSIEKIPRYFQYANLSTGLANNYMRNIDVAIGDFHTHGVLYEDIRFHNFFEQKITDDFFVTKCSNLIRIVEGNKHTYSIKIEDYDNFYFQNKKEASLFEMINGQSIKDLTEKYKTLESSIIRSSLERFLKFGIIRLINPNGQPVCSLGIIKEW